MQIKFSAAGIKGLFFLAILLTPALAAAPASYDVSRAQADEARRLVNRSLELIHLNQDDKAIELLRRAVEIIPDLPSAHHNLGLALAKTGRMQEAIAELKRAIELDDENAGAWLALGGIYQSSGQVARAIEAYEGFLANFPDHKQAATVSSLVEGFKKEFAGRLDQADTDNSGADYFASVFDATVGVWPPERLPIPVFIESGEGRAGYKPQFQDLLVESFRDWQAKSRGEVRFEFVENAGDARVICSWLDDPGGLSNQSEAGEARLAKDSRGLTKGSVKLLTVPLYASLPLTDNRLRRICLHEIGHILGMAGHSTNPADIMFFSGSLTDDRPELTERDANTLIRLYNLRGRISPKN